jgi:hypothetical protein
VEFIFEEEDPTTTLTNSQSTNTKRKLPSRLNFNFNEFQQNNISTYYFKHEQASHPVAVTPVSVNLDTLQDKVGGGDQSGEEEDSHRVDMSEDTKKPLVILEKEIEELVLRAEELARRRAEIVGRRKSGRIKKWVTSGASGGMRRRKVREICVCLRTCANDSFYEFDPLFLKLNGDWACNCGFDRLV